MSRPYERRQKDDLTAHHVINFLQNREIFGMLPAVIAKRCKTVINSRCAESTPHPSTVRE